MPAYQRKRDDGTLQWHYRKQVELPDGRKTRISGTPAINTQKAALAAERAHVERLLQASLQWHVRNWSYNRQLQALAPGGGPLKDEVVERLLAVVHPPYEVPYRQPGRLPAHLKTWTVNEKARRQSQRGRRLGQTSPRIVAQARRAGQLGGRPPALLPHTIGVTARKVLDDERIQARVDRHVERMREQYPGMTFTRTHAVRALLLKALCAEEKHDERSTGGEVQERVAQAHRKAG